MADENVCINSNTIDVSLTICSAIAQTHEAHPNAIWVFSKMAEKQDGDHVKFPYPGNIMYDQNPYPGERPLDQNPMVSPTPIPPWA